MAREEAIAAGLANSLFSLTMHTELDTIFLHGFRFVFNELRVCATLCR